MTNDERQRARTLTATFVISVAALTVTSLALLAAPSLWYAVSVGAFSMSTAVYGLRLAAMKGWIG